MTNITTPVSYSAFRKTSGNESYLEDEEEMDDLRVDDVEDFNKMATKVT